MAKPTSTQFAVAVHVLTYLASVATEARGGSGAGASESRAVSSDELARSVNANPVHVRRVLGRCERPVWSRPARTARRLAARSTRGGHHRGRGVDLVQGDDPVLDCTGASPACPVGRSIQHSLSTWTPAPASPFAPELDRITVADLAAGVTV